MAKSSKACVICGDYELHMVGPVSASNMFHAILGDFSVFLN